MKTLPFNHHRSHKRGMTLIELTVVILVLLSLVSILIVGGRAWKRGSDRSMSILLIRNTQMGLRSLCQLEGVRDDTYPDLPEALFGFERFVFNGIDKNTGMSKPVGELPDHPVKGLSFDFVAGDGDIIPSFGELYICTGGSSGLSDLSYNPQPSVYRWW